MTTRTRCCSLFRRPRHASRQAVICGGTIDPISALLLAAGNSYASVGWQNDI